LILLAIETSGKVASVALATKSKIIAEYTIRNDLTHSETLMPMVEQMLATSGVDKREIGMLACSNGPGSFTGLRIGAATAKGLAMGLNFKIVPVSSLVALAYNAYGQNALIAPIMDARRNEVYTALYSFVGEDLKCYIQPKICPFDDMLNSAADISESIVFLGDATSLHAEKILSEGFEIAPPHKLLQSAASVAMTAFKHLDKAVDVNDFKLDYIRLSQAERIMLGYE